MKKSCGRTASVGAFLLLASGLLFAGELMEGLEKDMAEIIARSKPFVVRITTEMGMPGLDEVEGFDDFFPRERRSGSGFIVDHEGYVLTTENVVRSASRIIVTLHDERQFEAKLVGKDRDSDVALLKIDAGKLKSAKIGDPAKTEPGSWAICIGHPFGLTETATLGIVSGKGRSGLGISTYEDLIQLDASINPGDSGGPVINSRGEVIGIIAAALAEDWPFGARAVKDPAPATPARRTRSISFAIPIDMAMDTADRLKEGGVVEKAWLGVAVRSMSPVEAAAAGGLSGACGAVVVEVTGGSPALGAGVEKGDVIVSYGGKVVRRAGDLPYLVSRSPAGQPVEIEIVRGGRKVTVRPVLRKCPAARAGDQ